MKVTVVIPTKNEEQTLPEVIERVRPYADEILTAHARSPKQPAFGSFSIIKRARARRCGM
jgi:hypothetical protein